MVPRVGERERKKEEEKLFAEENSAVCWVLYVYK